MTLKEYIKRTPEYSEITVYDVAYDVETYFYNTPKSETDAWDKALDKLASKLTVVKVCKNCEVIVNLSDVIEENVSNPVFDELFVDVDTDSIMYDMPNILAGYVSESWLTKFADCLQTSGTINSSTTVMCNADRGTSGVSFDFTYTDDYDSVALENEVTYAIEDLGYEVLGTAIYSVDYPADIYPEYANVDTAQCGVDFRWDGDYSAHDIEKALASAATAAGCDLIGIDFYSL